jgi:hypothetical protein
VALSAVLAAQGVSAQPQDAALAAPAVQPSDAKGRAEPRASPLEPEALLDARAVLRAAPAVALPWAAVADESAA